MNITLQQDSSRIDQNLYKSMTPLKRKTFSETMLIRRSPFLQCENENPQKYFKRNENDSANSHKKLKFSENKENHTKSYIEFRKFTIKTDELKSKEETIQNCASNTSAKVNKPNSGSIIKTSTSPHEKLRDETTGIETLTEFETENWLKLQNDLKTPKFQRETCKHKRQRSEIELGINENETHKENKRKFNQSLEIETKEIENIDFKKKQKISLRDLAIETLSRVTNEIDTSIAEESTQISGYYSEVSVDKTNSILEIDISTKNLLKHFNDKIKPLTNSTFICPEETSENETQEYQTAANSFKENDTETYDVEINHKIRNIEEELENNNDFKDSNNTAKKYPLYKPENFQIPLIIINEIEIIHHGLKTTEIETTTIKTLKVPVISIQSDFEENKELQKKLVEVKLHKQIEIKDKVMAHLLEIAAAKDFPKLKHLCNLMCEKNDDGSCKKLQMEMEKARKVEDESGGFFYTIWSAIKYPFVPNSNKTEEKENLECKMIEVKKEQKLEEMISKVSENIKEDLKRDHIIEAVEDKSDNKVKNSEKIILPNCLDTKRSTKDKPDNKPKKIKSADSLDDKNDIEMEMKDKNDSESETAGKIEDLLRENCDKSKDNNNKKNTENQKKKKGFFSIFSKKDKIKNENTTSNATAIEDPYKFDNMEEVLRQIEKEELEKLTTISTEALKKLDNYMAEKVTEQNTEIKSRMKRAGSF